MALRDELEQEEKTKPSLIKKAKDLVKAAKEQIKRYQSGKDKPIKTRYTHFNDNSLGGIFSGMIITIAGISGSGKTHVLQELENDIFDKELNPDCDEYVLLRCNWEMTVYKLLLRKLKNKLERTMRHILFNAPKGDELNKFNEVCESEENDNIFYLEEPTDPKTWYENVHAFLTENIKKKQVIVTIDHLALVRDLLGNKKKAMDDLVEYINSLKKEFKNVSFVLVSQMNRDIEGRTDVRHLAPKRSDLYNTDTLFQISDLVIVIHNPYKLGHEKYMVVSPK
ncbi:MAG: DnaB-like helicase C-terminal domain-containing protein, partial [Sphaerochaetaceae bacterium]|nr:DnaB-like helicase C-terminal domain-containing protein [Sphaerochaetaceae bacterium]